MEKQISSAFAKAGRSEEANLSTQLMLEEDVLMDKAYRDKYDELAKEDVQKWGYKRGDLESRARSAADSEIEKIFNRTSLEMRKIMEREKGVYWMYEQTGKKVDKGTPLTPEMFRIFVEKIGSPDQAMRRAKKLGYTVYAPDQLASLR